MELLTKFNEFYNRQAQFAAVAPGRLEILGNHTDYNAGLVLSCAVARKAAFALAKIPGRICKVKDFRDGSEREFDLDKIDRAAPRDWANYIRGVIVEFRKMGFELGAFSGAILSDVPLSGGMSSSAALEVAVAFALRAAWDIPATDAQIARLGQNVENNYLGLKTGLLDQFSSIFGEKGSFILSDFQVDKVVDRAKLPSGYKLVVVNSMIKHTLVSSEYNNRRRDCEKAAEKMKVPSLRQADMTLLEANKNILSNAEYGCAKHIIGENLRVVDGVKALQRGDAVGFGSLMYQSQESSRVNFLNSCRELDILVDLSRIIPGCLGARLSGGGFGGITVHLVEAVQAENYAERIKIAYQKAVYKDPEIFVCDIDDGAHLVPVI